MKILLLGSGGREHALAWKIAQSEKVEKLYIAPGNAGTANVGENVPIKADDFEALKTFVSTNAIDMVVVGPEDPLVKGIYDDFRLDARTASIPVIGPSKSGARLEGSKEFAKGFMTRHHIPTAKFLTVQADNLEEGIQFLEQLSAPYVLKADGLCAGKGVLIIPTLEEAKKELREMLDGMFGQASEKVVIEEFLSGIECSVFVLTDGQHYKILPEAKDYKRIGERDTGLNTGGMGSVTPVPFATPEWMGKVEDRIIRPTVEGLREEGIDYKGFIFFGLINVEGEPKVIEYNCRFGDPETQVVLPLLESDLLEIMMATTNGTLKADMVRFSDKNACCVVMASEGYPVKYKTGFELNIPKDIPLTVYVAGAKEEGGKLLTAGGRVLGAVAVASTLEEAIDKVYKNIDKIHFDNAYYRRDIGQRALNAKEKL